MRVHSWLMLQKFLRIFLEPRRRDQVKAREMCSRQGRNRERAEVKKRGSGTGFAAPLEGSPMKNNTPPHNAPCVCASHSEAGTAVAAALWTALFALTTA